MSCPAIQTAPAQQPQVASAALQLQTLFSQTQQHSDPWGPCQIASLVSAPRSDGSFSSFHLKLLVLRVGLRQHEHIPFSCSRTAHCHVDKTESDGPYWSWQFIKHTLWVKLQNWRHFCCIYFGLVIYKDVFWQVHNVQWEEIALLSWLACSTNNVSCIKWSKENLQHTSWVELG